MRAHHALLVTFALGCGGPSTQTLAPSAHVAPVEVVEAPALPKAPVIDCDAAAKLRDRVPALLADGKLDRTLRVIAAARAACPADERKAWAVEIATLAEIGRWDAVRALATRITDDPAAGDEATGASRAALAKASEIDVPFEDTDVAKAPMRDAYKKAVPLTDAGKFEAAEKQYLEAWRLWHPNGQALLQAGLVAEKRGDAAAAQRLFDRGVVELERVTGKHLELDTPNGFAGWVHALAWSSRGRIAVAHDAGVSLLVQSSLREELQLDTQAASVTFSPDGRTLVATSLVAPRTEVWDATTGARVGELPGGAIAPHSLAYSSDGKWLAGASLDASTVELWDATTRTSAFRFDGKARFRATAFAATQDLLAAGDANGTVEIWEAGSHRLVKEIDTALGDLAAVALSPDGAHVAAAGRAASGIWDVATGASISTGPGADHLAFVTNARLSLTDSGALEWQDDFGAFEAVPAGFVSAYAIAPGGLDVVTADYDGRVTVRSAEAGDQAKIKRTTGRVTDRVGELTFSRDGSTFASGGSAGRVWDLRRGKLVDLLREPTSVTFLPNGDWFTYTPRSGYVEVLRALESSFSLTADRIELAVASPRGTSSALLRTRTEPDDPQIEIWDLRTQTQASALPIDARSVTSMSFAPDDRAIAVGNALGEVRVWDLAKHRQAHEVDATAGITSVAYSANGELLAYGTSDGTLALLDAATFAVVHELHADAGVTSIAFHPTSRYLAAGASDGTLQVWGTSSGALVARKANGPFGTTAVAYDPSGDLLAAAGADGTVRLFRSFKLDRVGTLRSFLGKRAGYVFTDDGHVEFFGDASAGRALTSCRIGPQSYEFAVCRERFEVPGLLTKIVAADTSYLDP